MTTLSPLLPFFPLHLSLPRLFRPTPSHSLTTRHTHTQRQDPDMEDPSVAEAAAAGNGGPKLSSAEFLAAMGVDALPTKHDPLLAELEARYEAECEKVSRSVRGLDGSVSRLEGRRGHHVLFVDQSDRPSRPEWCTLSERRRPPHMIQSTTHRPNPNTQARQRAQRFGVEYKAPDRAAFFEKGELKRATRMRRDEGGLTRLASFQGVVVVWVSLCVGAMYESPELIATN